MEETANAAVGECTHLAELAGLAERILFEMAFAGVLTGSNVSGAVTRVRTPWAALTNVTFDVFVLARIV